MHGNTYLSEKATIMGDGVIPATRTRERSTSVIREKMGIETDADSIEGSERAGNWLPPRLDSRCFSEKPVHSTFTITFRAQSSNNHLPASQPFTPP
jgi:hypothetical protein